MLIPILIQVRRKIERGSLVNDYPDFNALPAEVREGMDWAHYIDAHGLRMHYDKKADFGQADEYNGDPDMQYCATMIPEPFAKAAVGMFPERVELLTEAEWAEFYDSRAHAHEPEQHYDVETLQALVAKQALGIALTDSDRRALDPDDAAAGIRKNCARCWKDMKATRVIKVHPDFEVKE